MIIYIVYAEALKKIDFNIKNVDTANREVVCLSEVESIESLKGTALEIYRFMLKARRPLGIRELQRALNLSSPSIVQYHLSKLEHAGLVKKKIGNYEITKVYLEHFIVIHSFLVPRCLFYTIFGAFILSIELTVLMPTTLALEYFFSTIAIAFFVLIFGYETIKVWRNDRI